MKKIFFKIELLALVGLFLSPLSAFAACTTEDPKLSAVSGLFSEGAKYCDVNSLVVKVITILLSIIAIISVLFIVIGGYQYVMSQGNDKAVGAARKTITYAVAGLVVAVLAYTVVAIINRAVS